MNEIIFPTIPQGSILGINYSGMHDSAIAVVSKEGEIIYCVSLERITRYKQDGRPPFILLDQVNWDMIDKIAVSTEKVLNIPTELESKIHPVKFSVKKTIGYSHLKEFNDFMDKLPKDKIYVCHQLSHANSAFWLSGYESALCLCYDGGMYNSPWFGGLYIADKKNGVKDLDRFSLANHPRVTVLYSAVTALLGFTPNKHEGKITGLAAHGKVTTECKNLLESYLSDNISELDALFDWYFTYDDKKQPALIVNEARRKKLLLKFTGIKDEDLAATVQEIAEEHIINIIKNARKNGWNHDNICLSGGLFSNVKLNQKVKQLGFKNIFICPPMTDDGTALGAAFEVLFNKPTFKPSKINTMSLGCTFDREEIVNTLIKRNIKWINLKDSAMTIAEKINSNKIVAVFINNMEFGPRSLGNRSILASAANYDINSRLNKMLNRTDFMPFAPMTRMEDADICYLDMDGSKDTARFMTITVDCREIMKKECPAVVHVDGTARPQLIDQNSFPFIHEVLTNYKELSEKPSIINTSFNIHEEPIVCTINDAIDGLLESGIDYLYFHPGILIEFSENKNVALAHLQEKFKIESKKSVALKDIKDELFERLEKMFKMNEELKNHISTL